MTAITVILLILAALAAIGFVLSPVLALSGWRAHHGAKAHDKAAQDIERLLSGH